ncbi:crotonobetainyl-CoA:carnitine CoA-transferase CaiB-like acyl-CoA transferase [Kibdelosporangium phytohabitans]|nr:crotonobetainyl-CoA:carnitine CoA-transferase CaiB-like acyl-CoA transferase [Kibdelosporangium phytohabitans]
MRRSGVRHLSISPYGPDRTGNGTVFPAVRNNREWSTLCRTVLARPDLVEDTRFRTNVDRVAHEAELTAVIEPVFTGLPAAEAVGLLDRAGIASAAVRTPDEFTQHPRLHARDRWRSVQTPGGSMRALLPPVEVAGREPLVGPVPALGAHNATLRAEHKIHEHD